MPPDPYANTRTPTSSADLRSQDQARDKQARIAAAKLANPPGPAQQAGSGQISNRSPILPLATDRQDFAGASQRQFRNAQPQTTGSAPDVYAPPADWRGKQYVNNPPPGGNQRPDYSGPKLIPMDTKGAIAPRAQPGESDAQTPGRFDAALKRNIDLYSTRYTQPAQEDNQPTPGREALLDSAMSPAGQAEAAASDRQRIEQQYAPDSLVLKEGDGTFNTAPAKVAVAGKVTQAQPFQYKAAPLPGNENWRQQIAQAFPDVMKAGTDQNKAFVEAMKMDGDPNNAMQIATRLFSQPGSGNAAIAKTPPAAPSAKPPGAGKAAPLSTEADFFAGNTTPEQDYRDQQAREVARASGDVQTAQAKSDARLAPPAGREIAPGTTGEIGAPKPRPAKYGTTVDPKRPSRLKLDPYS